MEVGHTCVDGIYPCKVCEKRNDVEQLRSALQAAEKGRDEAKSAIGRLRRYADDLEAAGAAYENRVQELEKALGEACDLVEAWNRSANSMEKPPASTRAKLARLRSLLRGDKPACGMCGNHRVIADGTAAKGVSWKPCPACSASPVAEKGR